MSRSLMFMLEAQTNGPNMPEQIRPSCCGFSTKTDTSWNVCYSLKGRPLGGKLPKNLPHQFKTQVKGLTTLNGPRAGKQKGLLGVSRGLSNNGKGNVNYNII